MLTERTRVAALGYVSSDQGDPIDDGEIKEQTAALESLCVRRGWTLAALVHEVTPVRRRASRPALSYALERLGAGDVSCLVVTDLGRLCRSVAGLHQVLVALEQVGARLVSLQPEIDTGTAAGRDAARILSAVSDWERRRTAERSRRGLAAARAKGALQPAIDPDLKRQIERRRAAGMTLQAIVDELNASGVPTVRGGVMWRVSSVQAAIGYKRPVRT
ncbi:MAG TPA: recombinase family protein [Solirubrobacteraceae bacterium]|jgi:DNA invertase Pin-like site-specific DNA recombinase|nr:recombinase family protein [Solirubrobacteraceae bacterium]